MTSPLGLAVGPRSFSRVIYIFFKYVSSLVTQRLWLGYTAFVVSWKVEIP